MYLFVAINVICLILLLLLKIYLRIFKYNTRITRWDGDVYLLNESVKEGEVPHHGHQEPLFPNRGLLNSIAGESASNPEGLGPSTGYEAGLRLFSASRPPSCSSSLFTPGHVWHLFYKQLWPHPATSLQGSPNMSRLILTAGPLHVLVPLPGIPSISICWCPLRKLIS